jgi:hypothetical protein
MGFLDRKFYFRQNEELVHKAFDVFDEQLEIFLPRWWMLQSHFGTDIPAQNIILINKLFEERFEEDLSKYCSMKGGKIKKSIEDFCTRHQISIDDDITFDALKQKEYRERKKMEKLYCKVVPSFSHASSFAVA